MANEIPPVIPATDTFDLVPGRRVVLIPREDIQKSPTSVLNYASRLWKYITVDSVTEEKKEHEKEREISEPPVDEKKEGGKYSLMDTDYFVPAAAKAYEKLFATHR